MLTRCYRRLSLQFYPGRGGSTEAMQAINAARDLLREPLAGRARARERGPAGGRRFSAEAAGGMLRTQWAGLGTRGQDPPLSASASAGIL